MTSVAHPDNVPCSHEKAFEARRARALARRAEEESDPGYKAPGSDAFSAFPGLGDGAAYPERASGRSRSVGARASSFSLAWDDAGGQAAPPKQGKRILGPTAQSKSDYASALGDQIRARDALGQADSRLNAVPSRPPALPASSMPAADESIFANLGRGGVNRAKASYADDLQAQIEAKRAEKPQARMRNLDSVPRADSLDKLLREDSAACVVPGMRHQSAPAGDQNQCRVSSNHWASGTSQNCGNMLSDRPTSRVLAPPGGRSSFKLG
jgi:hypothetical protein